MVEELISMYIDDELDLNEKILFVEKVHDNRRFKDETVELLWQEKQLRAPLPGRVPEVFFHGKRDPAPPAWRRCYALAGGLAATALVVFMLWTTLQLRQGDQKFPHRFVVYLPDTATAAITGSFNGWQSLPMQKAGLEGYWEILLDLPPGEHRYSFILDDGRRVADPTVQIREKDDFGTENSVLDVKI